MGFCGLNPPGCWFCMGDLKALVTCIGSPGKQQSSRAHCTDTHTSARWSRCYMRDNTSIPLSPVPPCTQPSGFGTQTLHCSPDPAAWQSPLQRSREQGLERKNHTRTEKSHTSEGYCIALVGGGEQEGGGARQGQAILLQTLSLRCSDPWRALAILLPAGRSQLRAIRVEAEKAPL